MDDVSLEEIIENQFGPDPLDGVYEDERYVKLRMSLLEAHFAALLTHKAFLNASIEFALNFLFAPRSEVVMMDNTEPSMWRKRAVTQKKVVQKRAKQAPPESIVTLGLKCVVMYDYLLAWILADYEEHAPNEYAFICSGYVVDGVVTLTDYYPGKMAHTTPVVCRLDEDFAQEVVYERVPETHNIICWSHVHPIEVPSHTDMEAFDTHARWDEEILENGIIKKRSIAMIISGHSHKVTIFDTHDYSRPLKHFVIPFGGKQDRRAM